MNRRERRAAAKKGKLDLNARVGAGVVAIHDAVIGEMRAGKLLQAQSRCQQALEGSPENPELLHLMALVCFNARQFDNAVEWSSRAIRKDPKPGYLSTLGTALLNLGKVDDALKVFERAVQLKPGEAGLWSNFGDALILADRSSDAAPCFRRAFEIDPTNWNAVYKAGGLFREIGRLDEAVACFDASDKLRPDHASTLHLRALALDGLKRIEEALRDNRRADELEPGNPYIGNSLGHNLMQLGRHREALPWFDQALEIRPDFVEALNNKAFSLTHLHRFDEALAVYERSQVVDPKNAGTEWHLALLQMLTGNFAAGWAGREARFRLTSLSGGKPKFSQPRWLGDRDIEGKTILLYSDEGLGDSIQFARYVPMVAERGARVVLYVQEAVRSLLSGISGVAECVSKSAALPAFDLYCPTSSLPLAFKTTLETIPGRTAYLPPPPDDRVRVWENRLGSHDRLRVGLVWSGNPKHGNDRERSIPLRLMTGLLNVDATFVSLQKDVRPDDKATLLERTDLVDLTAHLADFVETAALISCLDLVITVDTSVAHLSGALGRPTWIMLPYAPDYRWLLDRDDSPWYPTVRLFRQTESQEYGSVLDRVRGELAEMTNARKPADSVL